MLCGPWWMIDGPIEWLRQRTSWRLLGWTTGW